MRQQRKTWLKRIAHMCGMVVGGSGIVLCLSSCTQRAQDSHHGSQTAGVRSKRAAAPFLRSISKEVDVDLAVLGDRQPLTNVFITIRSLPHPSAKRSRRSAVLFQGMTQKDGHVRGRFVRNINQSNLDVLVYAPGHTGPYNDEKLRRQLGLFAPSAWIQVPAIRLSNATIQLHSGQAQTL